MADCDVAATSSGLQVCTLQKREYYFTLSSQLLLRVFDIVGIDASDSPTEIIRSLPNTEDIDLLLLCIKAGRFTDSMQRTHYLISELLRNHAVPLALVITHLEDEDVMEDWWERNEESFKTFGIYSVAHACVTAVPPHERLYAAKRNQSQRALEKLLHDVLCTADPSYMQAIRNRLAKLIKKPISVLTRRQRRNGIRRELETEYAFSPERAQEMAELIVMG